MANPIEFYFDFSSPYGYLAAEKIDALAAKHGRSVNWRPMLLGAVFKMNGMQPLTGIPLKGSYAKHDMLRSARLLGVKFKLPSKFPINTVAPCRVFYWFCANDAARARTFAQAVYRAYFTEDRDVSSIEITANIAAKLGVDKATVLQALDDPSVKERTKNEVDAAIERGVFGSPYIVIDGEPFWGADRLDQVERWLNKPW
jgi:2-hydroxychromene-2-carboxylate isomerase